MKTPLAGAAAIDAFGVRWIRPGRRRVPRNSNIFRERHQTTVFSDSARSRGASAPQSPIALNRPTKGSRIVTDISLFGPGRPLILGRQSSRNGTQKVLPSGRFARSWRMPPKFECPATTARLGE